MPGNQSDKEKQTGRAKKPGDYEKRIDRPLTADALAEYGELKTVPSGGRFAPGGNWEQSYRIWMTGGPWDNYQGCVTLKRSDSDATGFTLETVEKLLMPRMRSVHETRLRARCQKNSLATPESWTLSSRVYDVKTKKDFSEATVNQTGVFDGERISVTTNGSERIHNPAVLWTCNWSLFEAVQRQSPAGEHAGNFTILDDLDILKSGQRLSLRGEAELDTGGKTIKVLRYHQTGRGLLPTRYYVSQSGRLLLAHTELRAYILDPGVLETHRKKVNWIAGKELK